MPVGKEGREMLLHSFVFGIISAVLSFLTPSYPPTINAVSSSEREKETKSRNSQPS